jgi:hypothetical protein
MLGCVALSFKLSTANMDHHRMVVWYIDQMFLTGLSQTLIDALSDLGYNIPMLMPTIQDRLLDAISAILNLLFVTNLPASDKPEKIPPYGCPTAQFLPSVPRKYVGYMALAHLLRRSNGNSLLL